ncbi:hypothetical protein RCL_jg27560.t1 [Rhizophagus clarus]|uniref:Uncharacterized protein n=1 Tax=Rhizophagus clarus TaxID=94130 RepID=A0A8H3LZK5_9GLOM|nr:hypothetical protein RCL_jg27560.t1 [Rhizophagus clarus]
MKRSVSLTFSSDTYIDPDSIKNGRILLYPDPTVYPVYIRFDRSVNTKIMQYVELFIMVVTYDLIVTRLNKIFTRIGYQINLSLNLERAASTNFLFNEKITGFGIEMNKTRYRGIN